MLHAIKRELELRKGYLGNTIPDSLYFGGGTPSLLTVQEVEELILCVKNTTGLKGEAEVNFELNPDDADQAYIEGLKEIGVNRLSIGIQSFVDSELKWMNRVHDAQQSEEAIKIALRTGFDNFSIDLIYGIPGSDSSAWESNINRAFDCGANHISAYCLTVEKGTPLERMIQKGKLPGTDDELAEAQFVRLMDFCEQKGWEQYEVSNFCVPGHYSKHNTSYWKSEPYLGVGPSAHSFNGVERRWNVRQNAWYIQSMQDEKDSSVCEILTERDRFNELILTGLRTKWGVDLSKLEAFRVPDDQWNQKITEYTEQGLLVISDQTLRLSREGIKFADRIAMELFVD